MSKSTTIDTPDFDGHRWRIVGGSADGAVISVQYSKPTRLQYGENLDIGFEHMPSIAGLEILRLARRVKELEEELKEGEG